MLQSHKQTESKMKRTIIAIGGGEVGRIKIHEDGHQEQKPIETMVIDKKIIELTGKQNPTLVFIGAASGDSPAYLTAIKNHFENRLGVKVINLNLTDLSQRPNLNEIKNIIMGSDIVYIGGGNVTRLMKTLRETGTDNVLVEAYNHGIIMSGNSAGGCVWFEAYDNDEDEDFDGTQNTLKTKPALGFVKGYFCPHWNVKNETGIEKESISKDAVNKLLIKESKYGYGVDEGAAIMVQTDRDKQVMTKIISKPNANVYKLNHDIQNIRIVNCTQR